MIDYAAILASLYNRATVDSIGSAFRATLGGSSSYFGMQSLAKWRDPSSASRPSRVWAVWQPGIVAGPSGDMRDIGASWWIYDDPPRGSLRLLATLAALETLYGTTPLDLSGGRMSIAYIGRQFEDAQLGLLGREMRIVYRRL